MEVDSQLIIRMQEKLAWLEEMLELSGKENALLLERIEFLEREVKIISSRIAEPDAVRDLKDETPPPHY